MLIGSVLVAAIAAQGSAWASSAGEGKDESQFEEEVKLVASSSGQLAGLYALLERSTVPALSGYYFEIEQSAEAPAVVEDVYYDTKDGFLREHGHSFRLRTTRIAGGKTFIGLQFKEYVSKSGSAFARSESRSLLPLDPHGDIPAQAWDWVSGRRPSTAFEALSRLLGRKPELQAALTLTQKRAEVLMYDRGASLPDEYLADIFLDETSAKLGARTASFFVAEAEVNDKPKLPPGRTLPEFLTAARAAVRDLSRFLESDPRFAFERAERNKYQTAWEMLGGPEQPRRFEAHARPLRAVLAARRPAADIGREFIDTNMRQYAFRIEELLRLYAPRYGPRFDSWLSEVQELERRTGDCMRARDVARSARGLKTPPPALAYLERAEADCRREHAAFLIDRGWIAGQRGKEGAEPSRLDALLSEMRAVSWAPRPSLRGHSKIRRQ